MATSSSQRLAEGRTSEFLLVPSVVVPSYGPKMEIFTPILESMSNLRMCDQSEGRSCPYLLLPRLLTEGTLRPGRGGGWAGSGPASVLSLHIEEEEEEEEEVVEEEGEFPPVAMKVSGGEGEVCIMYGSCLIGVTFRLRDITTATSGGGTVSGERGEHILG